MSTTGAEIAKAYVAITVKAPGVQKDIAKELGAVDGSAAGKHVGTQFADGMKKTLAVTGAAVAAVLGTALVKGFERLKAIETAQAKMRGLGHDADTVAKAMDNALASVKGTAFGLGDAATVAGQLMAANIKPGEQLERVLKTVANNAAAAGGSFDEMGSIFARAATQANGVQNDVISQLADRGIPIYQALADQMGVTAGEVFKMASEGKINFETFAAAAEAAAGTVADEMGNTTTGAFDNMMAALGRLGAKMLEDIFPLIGPFFKDVTTWLDGATEKVGPLVEEFGTKLKGAVEGVKGAWEWMKNNSDWITPVAVGIGAATAAFVIWTAVTKTAAAIQLAYNAVMAANPIMLVVMAVAALVSGIIFFVTQTETGRKIWGEFTRFLGEAWANISSFFVTVWEKYLKPVFEGIGQVLKFVWESILKPVFDGIATVAKWVFENILLPLFQMVQFGFAIMAGILQGVWEFIIKPIFDGFGALFRWIYETIIVPIINGIVLYVKIWAAIFTWLWENAVKPAFDAIGAIFEWIWNNIISPVIGWIVEKVKLFGLGVQLLWTLYVQPVFAKIGEIFQWIWNTIISPVVTWIKEKLDLLGLGFRVMYEQYIKPAWDSVARTVETGWNTIKGIIDTLVRVIQSDPKKAFEAARDAIGTAWKGIQDLAKAPVRFVIETVINGLIGTINQIPGVNIPKVPLPAGFSAGGYTGALPTNAIAGVVHGDEHVIRAASRRMIERSNPGLLDHMNRYGTVPGYARGGLVHPLPGAAVTTEFGGYPGHRGIDLAKPAGTPILAAASGAVSYSGWYGGGGNSAFIQHGGGLETRYKHMISTPIVGVGQFVKQKQVIGYEGSTGNSTGPHLHYEVIKNGVWQNPRAFLDGAGDAGLFDIIAGLSSSVMKQFTDRFPGSDLFVAAAGGLLKQGVDSVIGWATEKLSIGGDLMPSLYDNGGWLNPGTHLVENRSGRPEPILTATQWDALLETRGGGVESGDRLVLVLEDGTELGAYVDRRAVGVVAGATRSASAGALTSRHGARRS